MQKELQDMLSIYYVKYKKQTSKLRWTTVQHQSQPIIFNIYPLGKVIPLD